MTKTPSASLCAAVGAALLLVQLTTANAQSAPEAATPANPSVQTTTEPAAAVAPADPVPAPKVGLMDRQIPKLVIRWDCGDCEKNEKVSPLIEKQYADKASAKGYAVSDSETAEMVVTKYRQRPPGVRVMFGFMAGKDILETRVTFRGKESLAGEYSANAFHGMDSLCEAVAQLTLDQMLATVEARNGVASVGVQTNTQ